MGKKLWHQLVDFLGFADDSSSEENAQASNIAKFPSHRLKRGEIVDLNKKLQNNDVVVMYPLDFSDVKQMVESLLRENPVVVNLENVDEETAKRILDFMSGAVFALRGQSQKVGKFTFLFAPNGVAISSFTKLNDDK